MLLPDLTSLRSSGVSLPGIEQPAGTSSGSGAISIGSSDRFQQSAFQSAALSGIYTDRGTLETFITPSLNDLSPIKSATSTVMRSAMSAYQAFDTGGTSTVSSFPAPLPVAIQTGVADTSLFGLSYPSAGNVLNLLA